jgi:methionyl-tRNA synthetase
MRGHEVHFVGADDTHGTPIMLRAEKEGVTPKELIANVWKEHKRDFDDFLVSFDNYYSTDSAENKTLSEEIYIKLREAGFIEKRAIEQAYDPVKEMFLPDRFIKGECPKCGAKDQYGDSRDAPYFGFEIPDAPGKYFYVWLDAPIGYYASFLNLCQQKGLDFNEWTKPDTTTEQYHFIGKDILYFHTLFWPATLHFSGYRTPTNVFAHGFLTVDGEKMSKSRGTFITAHSVIECGLNPEWLRYYFAAKLNASMEDLDLNLQDFTARVNSDLLGKYINIASRSAGFLVKRFGGIVDDAAMNHPLLGQLADAKDEIADLYETREYAKALRRVMELADLVNGFVDSNKPWEIAKDPSKEQELQTICSITLEAFRRLTVYLKPVVPNVAAGVEHFFNIAPMSWDDVNKSLSSKQAINPYQHLMTRIDPVMIEKLIEANQE